jgi:outer membrane protein assembly factor BamB
VADDGTVYIGGWDGNLYALNSTNGSLKWKYATGQSIGSSPSLGPDGSVYFGNVTGSGTPSGAVYALNGQTGALKWKYASYYVESSPAVGADGTVYVWGSGRLTAFSPADGSVKWSYDAADYGACSPAIGVDGTVYAQVGSGTGSSVFAFYP